MNKLFNIHTIVNNLLAFTTSFLLFLSLTGSQLHPYLLTSSKSNASNHKPNPRSYVSYPNFIWRLSFSNILIIASQIELLDTSCRTIQKVFRRFEKEYGKYPKGKGKRVIRKLFLTLGSPRLASGSPGPPNNFMVK